jgi:hypothetical protein
MGWQDPSPRARARSPVGDPSAQPGYGSPGARLSFMSILARAAIALMVAGLAYAGAHRGLGGWLGAAHAMLVVALSAALAVVVGGLVLRALVGLPESGSGGRGGWFDRRRGWDDSSGLTFGEADAVGEVVGAIIDAATD